MARSYPFICVGTDTKREHWWVSIFHLFHRRFQPTHLDLSDQEEEQSLLVLPGPKDSCGMRNRKKGQVLEFGWQKIILFWLVHELSTDQGNSLRVLLQVHVGAKWRGRMLELDVGRSRKGNARREVHALELLGRDNSDCRLHIESNICLRDKGVVP